MNTTYELFHEIAHAASAQARSLVVELALKERVDFRNVSYDEAQNDFESRGGTALPALWDGSRLHQGLDAIETLLRSL